MRLEPLVSSRWRCFFERLMEPLGDGTLLREVPPWGWALRFYSQGPLPVLLLGVLCVDEM